MPYLDRATRLSPHDPFLPVSQWTRALALFNLDRHRESAAAAQAACSGGNPIYWAFAVLAAALLRSGELDKAREAVRMLLARKPDFSIAFATDAIRHVADWNALIAAWRELGVPE